MSATLTGEEVGAQRASLPNNEDAEDPYLAARPMLVDWGMQKSLREMIWNR